MRRIWIILTILAVPAAGQDDGAEFFENDVRPLLSQACGKCHGEKRQRGGLRLDSFAAILRGGERGPAVVAGDPEASLLIRAVRYGDPELQMPPKSKLEDDDVATLVAWVERGAPGPAHTAKGLDPTMAFDLEARRSHWSLQPLKAAATPTVSDAAWPRTDVDHFVLARLEQAGLAPGPDADPIALIRRASFVLTGLPPRPAEVEAYLADGEPGAFERVIERLLASPHFGERWARHWLDVVRYAESRGHEYDFDIPNAHEYRDWVIRAFNADVPYDRFVTEQIAGDLVADRRLDPEGVFDESVLGTGFWFLGEEVHAPVDVRLDETERQADKIDTLTKAFLGLTVACARCHDHKFDAVTQRDYYALAGFVVSSSYRQVRFQTARTESEELLRVTAEQEVREPALREAIAAAVRAEAERCSEFLLAVREVRHAILGKAMDAPDRVVADFEHDDWSGWEVEGDAFGTRPARLDQAPPQHGIIGGRGSAAAQSAAILGGEDFAAANARTGTLTSPPFTIDRDWLHLSVAGGPDPRTIAVRIVIDGEIVALIPGGGQVRLKPHAHDVRGYRGRSARLVIVDADASSGVSVDHVVLSDDGDSEATTGRPSNERRRRLQDMTTEVARRRGLDENRLRRWIGRCAEARDDDRHPLHGWSRLCESRSTAALDGAAPPEASEALPADARVLIDAADAGKPALLDGSAWGRGPRGPGEAIAGVDSRRPILAFTTRAAWWTDPRWSNLPVASGVQLEPGRLDWMQAGVTLRTPGFRLTSGRLWYLVRGGGRAYAAVASHRLNHDPLHGEFVRKWSGGDDWVWVEHDLRRYAGLRVRIEFSPETAFRTSPLALAVVVDSETPPTAPDRRNRLSTIVAGAESVEDAADRIEQGLGAAAATIENGEGDRDGLALATWAMSMAEPSAIAAAAGEFVRATRPRLGPSRTAPAMLDSGGVDEEFLVRGLSSTPRGTVPRRFLEVFDGDEPMVEGAGSGRLALARRIVDDGNPLTARVWVNRVWHHLFGRGIVASVDDFGVMGERPTHPELLDRLALEFLADGQSTKRLIARLLRSRTWGLATGPPDTKDEENSLLGRAHVRRLEGEAIRDAMLAVSGRLDRKLFGRPVPIKLTDFHGGRGRPNVDGPLDGARRRSIYTAVRRNFPVPLFHAFDVPSPAHPVGARHASNVPAQALALMNGPFIRQQAEAWARRVIPRGRTVDARIELLWREGLGRPPAEAERRRVAEFVATETRERSTDADDRELWTDVCHSVFNLEEFVFLP